jgi:hypothetical protein
MNGTTDQNSDPASEPRRTSAELDAAAAQLVQREHHAVTPQLAKLRAELGDDRVDRALETLLDRLGERAALLAPRFETPSDLVSFTRRRAALLPPPPPRTFGPASDAVATADQAGDES